ncbi:hypothetical protein E4T56_gene3987 [Termitomyces sp. T112]|nr:hypothetical protein E4T56_gene3987 [Termitomyces sp. T112]
MVSSSSPALPSPSLSPDFAPNLPNSHLFSPGPPLPKRPNTDPCCNSTKLRPPSSSTVSSPLVIDAWRYYLHDYPDPTFVSTLLNIIQFGAAIGFLGEERYQSCINLKSAIENKDFVKVSIQSLIEQSHAMGPFASPPFLDFCCSPLGSKRLQSMMAFQTVKATSLMTCLQKLWTIFGILAVAH